MKAPSESAFEQARDLVLQKYGSRKKARTVPRDRFLAEYRDLVRRDLLVDYSERDFALIILRMFCDAVDAGKVTAGFPSNEYQLVFLRDAFEAVLDGRATADEALGLAKPKGRPRGHLNADALADDDDVMPWLAARLSDPGNLTVDAIFEEAAERFPRRGRGWKTLKKRFNEPGRRTWYEYEASLCAAIEDWLDR